MANRKSTRKSAVPTARNPGSMKTSSKGTVSGPSTKPGSVDLGDKAEVKMAAVGELAAAMPFNANKPAEYGDAARTPAKDCTPFLPFKFDVEIG